MHQVSGTKDKTIKSPQTPTARMKTDLLFACRPSHDVFRSPTKTASGFRQTFWVLEQSLRLLCKQHQNFNSRSCPYNIFSSSFFLLALRYVICLKSLNAGDSHTFPVGEMQLRVAEFCYVLFLFVQQNPFFQFPLSCPNINWSCSSTGKV